MTDISSFGMVSYYNPLAVCRQQQQQPGASATGIPQQLSPQAQQYVAQAQAQHAAAQQQIRADSSPTQQYWYGYPHGHPAHAPHHHHQTSGPQQYLEHAADVLGWPPHHPHHYSHHLQYQHQQAAYQQHQHQQQQQAQQAQLAGAVSEWSGDESSTHHHQQQQAVIAGEPSPPITVSGSELSSPGTPSSPTANNNNNNPNATNNNSASTTPMRPSQIRSPFEWMKKPSYQSQPNPACNVAAINTGSVTGLHELCPLDVLGKTRTKDKYRVVYTDHQRLELEKEFHYSRYITIRRKAELAANLALSERQVKIWFQNRRAKERKQSKKREELEQKDIKPGEMGSMGGGMASLAALGGMGGMLGGLMHNGGSPPLSLGPPPHSLAGLGHPASSLHAHQHAHPHAVLGL